MTSIVLTIPQLLAVLFGGALGALMRYIVSTTITQNIGANFPYGTLAVNIIGSFLMGFLSMWLVEKIGLDPVWRMAIFVGFLGAFTTFSTFSLETLNLFEQGLPLRALLNMFMSVVLSVLAVWLGVLVGRSIS